MAVHGTVGVCPKAEQVASLLERRILHGDYQGQELPTERELADETGVSRMTARKALQRLVDRGLLARKPNGRVMPESTTPGRTRLALLVPSVVSPDVESWRLSLERVATAFNATVRTILYLHWDDPAVPDALDSFDGVFVYLSCETVPVWIIDRLRDARRGVAVLGRNLTSHGIPSVNLFPAVFVQRLLDLLANLGHRSIDCFNIQTIDPTIEQRLEQWNLWRAVHRMSGSLLGEPIPPYGVPLRVAYEQAGRLLDQDRMTGTAILCTTVPAALGVIRAMHDRRMRVGVDKSVCVFNDEGLARFLSPSLTSIEMPSPDPYLAVCLEWMQRAGSGWVGSLLMQPADLPVFHGESTGPARIA